MRARTEWGLAAVAAALLAVSVGAVAGAGQSPPVETRPPNAAEPTVGSYVEVEDGRTLARLEAAFVPAPGGPRLVLHVRAVGRSVDGAPDWTGVPGVNLTTAREIDALLRADTLAARVRRGERVQAAAVEGLPHRRLPTRQLAPDGRIDFEALSEPLPTGLRVLTPPLARGRHVVEVLARDEMRLVVRVEVTSAGARVEEMRAAGGLHRNLKALSWDPVR